MAQQVVYAIHNFDAENDDEINFRVGDPIVVLERDDKYMDGWWQVHTTCLTPPRNLLDGHGLILCAFAGPQRPRPCRLIPNELHINREASSKQQLFIPLYA